jgi:hypothetical protein
LAFIWRGFGWWPGLRIRVVGAAHEARSHLEFIGTEARIVIAFSQRPAYEGAQGSFDSPLGAVDDPLDDASP